MDAMTPAQIRQFTTQNDFDTIIVNGLKKSEYQARQYLLGLVDQAITFQTEVRDNILHLTR